VANTENQPAPDKGTVQFDSLNMDIVEPTEVVDDYTVRPMPDSLLKWLKLPPYDEPSSSQPPPESPKNHPPR
jgi:hypothetical protein